MFPGKEELIQLEKSAKEQVKIYNDAEDYGILLNNESKKIELRNLVQSLRKMYQSEVERYGNESFGGSETTIWITQEQDDGIYRGTRVDIGYHYDKNAQTSNYGKNIEFITINFSSWSGKKDTFLES